MVLKAHEKYLGSVYLNCPIRLVNLSVTVRGILDTPDVIFLK